MKPRLVIFAKAPLMGKAKTRLAADVGYPHAQRLYRAMTANVLRRVTDPRWETVLAVSPDRRLGQFPLWERLPQVPQGQGSLSPRLARAFATPRPTCVIGTDCPGVEAQDIANAFRLLRRNALVLGPADDGGFWLMAARGPLPEGVFEDVRWSTEHALKDVAANSPGPVARLRTLTDADDLRAWRRASAEAKGGRARRLS